MQNPIIYKEKQFCLPHKNFFRVYISHPPWHRATVTSTRHDEISLNTDQLFPISFKPMPVKNLQSLFSDKTCNDLGQDQLGDNHRDSHFRRLSTIKYSQFQTRAKLSVNIAWTNKQNKEQISQTQNNFMPHCCTFTVYK